MDYNTFLCIWFLFLLALEQSFKLMEAIPSSNFYFIFGICFVFSFLFFIFHFSFLFLVGANTFLHNVR